MTCGTMEGIVLELVLLSKYEEAILKEAKICLKDVLYRDFLHL